jgi:hypothetical protein
LPSPRDLDHIVHALHAEARARKSPEREMARPAEPTRSAARVTSLPPLEVQHVADFLALPLDAFVNQAYVRFLGRLPDAGGATYYRRGMLRGRLTRIEVLGRIAYSAEGRRRGVSLPGLAPAFVLATAYRIPIAGPILAIFARLLRLPAHCQDRSTLEATALASSTWMSS